MNRKLFLLSLVAAVFTLAIAGCQREGCTDPKATNYDSDAKKDNGTCVYPTTEPVIPTKEISIDMTWHDIFYGEISKDTISYYAAQQDVKFVTLQLETNPKTGYKPASFRRARDTLQTRFDISPKVMGAGTIVVSENGAQLPDVNDYHSGMALEDSTWFASHGFTVRRSGATKSR
ncbi:MAG: hypothetical protein J6S84_04180 [Bacteroidales bacterium]|nr:hypothetical protein [Bacteroidales bacterium]